MSSFSVFSLRSTSTLEGGGYLLSASGNRKDKPDLVDDDWRVAVPATVSGVPRLSSEVAVPVRVEVEAPLSVSPLLVSGCLSLISELGTGTRVGGPIADLRNASVRWSLPVGEIVCAEVVPSITVDGAERVDAVVSLFFVFSGSLVGRVVLRIASCHLLA